MGFGISIGTQIGKPFFRLEITGRLKHGMHRSFPHGMWRRDLRTYRCLRW
jgi:hypothetical protein